MNRRAMTSIFRTLAIGLAASATLVLSACGSGPSESPPLEGATIGGDFMLTGKDGKPVRWSDFDGKYRIVYFGYTFCPDVCPVDMQNIGQGVRILAKEHSDLAAKVVPLFITIDPQRDTPAVVGAFAANFGPSVVGLTGTQAQIDAVAKKWAVFHSRREGSSPTDYLMDHSRGVFLMGPKGEPIALLPGEKSGQAVAAELAKWVH
ncbi:MAG: SCO family protein [Novosphingobium sp. 28-62-57]|uniref:SCO family protein n=1 Tax=unclassified Novosphingobium TaxID=2644732 RepID=UPI000BDD65C5|nr:MULTISPECIES: SCO family protein [unclassified Novosphingobium]OYW48676.1 MAG: SCO family protein [Novosphingobium sp. 12-62-10]OYZ10228.1 MAG: SCO family protein [Novosphingobium sp. 28-62-57]OZA34859.1 MAG: SCO family protein [Novosphingobium sp. 17-62-9]HQS70440.1 SCO family protein [Novosphingobium sp.]